MNKKTFNPLSLMPYALCLFVTFNFLLSTFNCSAQGVSINANGTSADNSAMLDVSSTSSPFQGQLCPRLTIAQRNSISSPANGLFIFNIDCNNFNYNAGTPATPNWLQINPSPNIPGAAGSISGSTPVCTEQNSVAYSVPAITNATSYIWSYSGTGATISGSTNSVTIDFASTATSGILTVVGSNSCGNSSVGANFSITVNPKPTVTITNPAAACSPATLDLTAPAITSGSTSGLTFTYWTDASATITYSTPAAATTGTYYIKGTTAAGCYDIKPVTVTVNSSPVAPSSAAVDVNNFCSNAGGDITLTATGGSGTTLKWYSASCGGTAAGTGTPLTIAKPTTTNTYYARWETSSCGNSSCASVTVTVNSYSSGNQTFSYTGASQTFTVPSCVTSITVDASGASGKAGGYGGRVQTTLSVTTGETLNIYVGGTTSNASGGFNGGGTAGGGTYNRGGGGGASDIRRGGTALSNRVVVAGGGGGGGDAVYGNGGQNGDTGYTCASVCGGGGVGATQSGGGAGGSANGSGSVAGSAGGTPTQDQGGNGGYGNWVGGGGGGGGYYGGGGGGGSQVSNGGGGGGGSSYSSGTGTTYTSGYQTSSGQIIISW
ncbi:MAG: hypothetical protein HGB12_09220 [Bacteroidetes bacterium]|nr:hypothetical protein [Bacteroidota bacterium]